MKLIDRIREVMALKHYARRTRECYEQWIIRYLKFHRSADGTWRHPDTMGEAEVEAFLTDLAVRGKVSASTQNQALAALLFLHQGVLGTELGEIDACRACRPVRVPVVLSADEVTAVLGQMQGVTRLMAELLYGSGLRLLECCSLRIKDVDLSRRQLTGQLMLGRSLRGVHPDGLVHQIIYPLKSCLRYVKLWPACSSPLFWSRCHDSC